MLAWGGERTLPGSRKVETMAGAGRFGGGRWWRDGVAAMVFCGVAAYAFLRSHVYRAPATVHLAAFRLRTLGGELLPAEAVTGRVAVLNFWAPWCGPCREEMPGLDALQRDHPEVTVLGVEDDPDALAQALGMAQTLGLSYALALPNEELRRALGRVPVLPTTLYLSASGRVVHTVTGAVPASVMRGYLADAVRSR